MAAAWSKAPSLRTSWSMSTLGIEPPSTSLASRPSWPLIRETNSALALRNSRWDTSVPSQLSGCLQKRRARFAPRRADDGAVPTLLSIGSQAEKGCLWGLYVLVVDEKREAQVQRSSSRAARGLGASKIRHLVHLDPWGQRAVKGLKSCTYHISISRSKRVIRASLSIPQYGPEANVDPEPPGLCNAKKGTRKVRVLVSYGLCFTYLNSRNMGRTVPEGVGVGSLLCAQVPFLSAQRPRDPTSWTIAVKQSGSRGLWATSPTDPMAILALGNPPNHASHDRGTHGSEWTDRRVCTPVFQGSEAEFKARLRHRTWPAAGLCSPIDTHDPARMRKEAQIDWISQTHVDNPDALGFGRGLLGIKG